MAISSRHILLFHPCKLGETGGHSAEVTAPVSLLGRLPQLKEESDTHIHTLQYLY